MSGEYVWVGGNKLRYRWSTAAAPMTVDELVRKSAPVTAYSFILLSGYFAWMLWSDGLPAASVYFAFVALVMLAEPVAFPSSTIVGRQGTVSNPGA